MGVSLADGCDNLGSLGQPARNEGSLVSSWAGCGGSGTCHSGARSRPGPHPPVAAVPASPCRGPHQARGRARPHSASAGLAHHSPASSRARIKRVTRSAGYSMGSGSCGSMIHNPAAPASLAPLERAEHREQAGRYACEPGPGVRHLRWHRDGGRTDWVKRRPPSITFGLRSWVDEQHRPLIPIGVRR
jgi:hypothetical protein